MRSRPVSGPFCPDLLAVHRAGPEDNRIIGKEMQEMRRAFRAPVRLDRNFLLPPRPTGGVIRPLFISSNGDCCPRKAN